MNSVLAFARMTAANIARLLNNAPVTINAAIAPVKGDSSTDATFAAYVPADGEVVLDKAGRANYQHKTGDGVSAVSALTANADDLAYVSIEADGGGGTTTIVRDREGLIIGHGHTYFSGGTVALEASGSGSLAMGNGDAVSGVSASIKATGDGSLAVGNVTADGPSAQVIASGNGGFALAHVYNEDCLASGATNCGQFGPGTNTLADSFQFWSGVRHCKSAPTTPKAGDLWVDASSQVNLYSAGKTFKFTSTGLTFA